MNKYIYIFVLLLFSSFVIGNTVESNKVNSTGSRIIIISDTFVTGDQSEMNKLTNIRLPHPLYNVGRFKNNQFATPFIDFLEYLSNDPCCDCINDTILNIWDIHFHILENGDTTIIGRPNCMYFIVVNPPSTNKYTVIPTRGRNIFLFQSVYEDSCRNELVLNIMEMTDKKVEFRLIPKLVDKQIYWSTNSILCVGIIKYGKLEIIYNNCPPREKRIDRMKEFGLRLQ